MTRFILLVAALVTAAVVASGAAQSGANSHNGKFGPYPSQTPDSGTCGPTWATDNVNRHFKIRRTGANTFDVTQKFKRGRFTTVAGPSPGACDSSDGTGPGIVLAGVTGKFHGYLRMTITSATYTPATAACAFPCATTGQFILTVFGPGYTRDD
jgi:hypothetical protein